MRILRTPLSTVASCRAPYVLTLEVQACDSHQTLSVDVVLARAGAADEPLHQEVCIPSAPPVVSIRVEMSALAPGDYAGTLRLRGGGTENSWPLAFHRLTEPVAEPVPFAIYAVPLPGDDLEACRKRLREVREAGLNMICQHVTPDTLAAMMPALDEAAKLGLRVMPSIGLQLKGKDLAATDRYRLSREDLIPVDYGGPELCFGSPAIRRKAAELLEQALQAITATPVFDHRVYYGDDFFMGLGFARDGIALSCYCDRCRAAFRARTGVDAPLTTARVEGVVPADHPWLLWNRERCAETFGGFVRQLEETRRAVAPGVLMGLVHGFPFAPFTYARCGIYSPLSMPLPAISSYAYPYLRSPRQDLIAHYEIGRMGNRAKPIWMLGAINSNYTNYPSWQVYQNFWNMLAAGYDFMALFGWWDFVSAESRGLTEHLEECKQALATCGRAKDWLFPVAARWTPRRAPFATLYSFTTEIFDIAPENRGHAHLEAVLAFYRQALRRQVPMEILCEEEVRSGELNRYEAVCLLDARVLPADVVQALDAYVARGGTVFTGNDILREFNPARGAAPVSGAIQVAPETIVAMLRDRQPPEITVDSEHITLRRLTSGEVDYVVLVNNSTDQYWGCTFEYWDQRVRTNYEHMTYVRDSAVRGEVRFAQTGRWLADLASGEIVGSTDEPLALTLPPSWGRVLALLPCRSVRLALTAPRQAPQGGRTTCTVEALTDTGQRLRGAFAAQLVLRDSAGIDTGRGAFLSLQDGVTEFELPLAVNDPVGAWTLELTGGFPRATSRHVLTVTPCEAQPVLLRCDAGPAHPDA